LCKFYLIHPNGTAFLCTFHNYGMGNISFTGCKPDDVTLPHSQHTRHMARGFIGELHYCPFSRKKIGKKKWNAHVNQLMPKKEHRHHLQAYCSFCFLPGCTVVHRPHHVEWV